MEAQICLTAVAKLTVFTLRLPLVFCMLSMNHSGWVFTSSSHILFFTSHTDSILDLDKTSSSDPAMKVAHGSFANTITKIYPVVQPDSTHEVLFHLLPLIIGKNELINPEQRTLRHHMSHIRLPERRGVRSPFGEVDKTLPVHDLGSLSKR